MDLFYLERNLAAAHFKCLWGTNYAILEISYLFKDDPIQCLYTAIFTLIGPEWKQGASRFIGAPEKKIFYHLILEGLKEVK